MSKRYMAIWFRHLLTDAIARRQPELKTKAFILAAPEHGRMIVKAVNSVAYAKGIQPNMVVADCKALFPQLEVLDFHSGKAEQLLNALAEWSIRYTPYAAVDLPEGLMLDVSGCPHLWGGESNYLKDFLSRMHNFGYDVRAAIADTIGCAWAISRYGQLEPVIEAGRQLDALLSLSPVALRIDEPTTTKLAKLGLYDVKSLVSIPRSALRRRFGQVLLTRLDQALGQEIEMIQPVCPVEPYQERLPSLEPIRTATGIEIALKTLLEKLCKRLTDEAKGLRTCIFKCYRIDGNIQKIQIGTTRPSRNVQHLFRLLENKIVQITPALGIELFILEAPVVEDLSGMQDVLWASKNAGNDQAVAELLDRISGKIGPDFVHRYLPSETYWPERSYKEAGSLTDKPDADWRSDLPRPILLLSKPEPILVTVPLPDYPPMLFIYKGKIHNVKKADGPERIKKELWLKDGETRDYYCLEDQLGGRYWIYRVGRYEDGEPKWFIHGFFA